ncbi:diguanylate cyclase domain-containing protein [Siccirubricoccus phaeus]|uniref:diguanylate cyclase domain-containing protein n=1 Tax=Siccirubricoccus phaeus TaxID=2595053 RepID=UPI00165B949D|nr:diguanylate cyclase [Siccirubricoccus phaeus]
MPSPEMIGAPGAAPRDPAVPPPDAEPGFRVALLESRHRWRDIASLAIDLAFETDPAGRLAFLSPDPFRGWPAEWLLGKPAQILLLHPEPDPFALLHPVRGLRTWLRHASGSPACFSLALVPLADAGGSYAGLRGCGRDVTAEVQEAEAQAAALRRAAALETLARRVRRQVLAPRMLAATLESLPPAIGCSGAALLELAPGGAAAITRQHGVETGPLLPLVAPLMAAAEPRFLTGPGGEHLVLLPTPHRVPPFHALLVWRAAGERDFDADDRHLLHAIADLLFVTLGNHMLQRELELQARTDALTGLLNRRAFMDDLRRRLDRPGERGALLFIDLDNFKPINDTLGHEAGDAALVAVAAVLREMARPVDLAARLGGDEFALWLEDADAAATGRRAAALCAAALRLSPWPPGRQGPKLTFSIGGAVRGPGAQLRPDALVAAADAAMYAVKRGGRGHWRLAPPSAPEAAG